MKRLVLALAILLPGAALALDWETGGTCEGSAANGIKEKETRSWCPTDGAAASALEVARFASCQWDADTTGTGTVTLSITGTDSSGIYMAIPADASCDAAAGNDVCQHFILVPGRYTVTPSGTATNGRVVCKGY